MRALTLRGVLLIGGVLLAGIVFSHFQSEWRIEGRRELYRQAVMMLKAPFITENGEYWVGDVAGLYPLRHISREVAEADTAPIHPLVDRPKPFHGYYVRSMESAPGPTFDGPVTVSLKGHTTFKGTSAFCIYPADEVTPRSPMWIVSPWGIYRRTDGKGPITSWPNDNHGCPIGWGIDD